MLEILSTKVSMNLNFYSILFSSILALFLSFIIAYVYEKTFIGLSYSKTYVHSLILSSIVTNIVMLAIGDSIARGIGMIGAMSLIRFRTNFKDSWDLIFMFMSLAIGIACGVFAYSVAVAGTIVFVIAALGIFWASKSSIEAENSLFRVSISSNPKIKASVESVLKSFCNNFTVINLKEQSQGGRLDLSYELRFKKNIDQVDFINKVKIIESVENIHVLSQKMFS